MPETSPSPLTLKRLQSAVAGQAAAIRVLTRLVPAGGSGDKVFPPTYKHPDRDLSTYASETRRIDGREVATVLLDSVASQANRLEEALLKAVERDECQLPLLSVCIPREGKAATRVTSLEAPHRFTDAIFRDCLLDGQGFRGSPLGKRLVEARLNNAADLCEYSPTALLFGYWDSQSGSGPGARLARALASEIIGLDAVPGRRTGSRLDPLSITADAAKIYASDEGMWTLEEKEATKEKNKPKPYGKGKKAGKPSAINHGNVTPSVSGEEEPGGMTISEALQTTVLSLLQLRRLRFPVPEKDKNGTGRDEAVWTVLAALGLYAVALQAQDGYFLRSRCHLVPLEPPRWELVGATARQTEAFSLDAATALSLLTGAREQAKSLGLLWQDGPVELKPTPKLVELVRRSDRKVQVEGGDDDAGD
jgi:CRISPR-associated protein Csb1